MASLKAELSEFFGRALIVARGSDSLLASAERAMAERDFALALRYARQLLADVPRSPIALLLAADAAEGALLDEQTSAYLADLAQVVPWRAEVWLRLGLARKRAGAPSESVREALGRAASDLASPEVAIRGACELAKLDLSLADPQRALAWLDRTRGIADVEAQELRAFALSELGDMDAAADEAASLDAPGPLDGRRSLLFGRLSAHAGGDAARYLVRAYVLDEPGAGRELANYIAHGGERALTSLKPIVEEQGDLEAPLFRAAFAEARGDRAASIEALGLAAEAGDLEAAQALATLAFDVRDPVALSRAHRAMTAKGAAPNAGQRALSLAFDALSAGDPRGALDALDRAGQAPWAVDLRTEASRALAPKEGPMVVALVLDEIRRAARVVDDSRALLSAEALAAVASRPLRVAVMGEFNAGKSTFVNALLGADIAPTGVLPTTATLHHIVFSPDPFARIESEGGPERVVSPERLRAAISEVQASGGLVTRVTVGLPLERLRHIELVDTPGFNAPDAAHTEEAQRALAEVHLCLWLLDAGQPWKESERRVLAEVRREGVPVQLLLNKIDRVPAEERERVKAYVAKTLLETQLESMNAIIPFSSREALAGRLGDADALARSGWQEVETMIESTVVARAPELRDGALRRRARIILAGLLERARDLAAAELSTLRAEAADRAALLASADALGRDQAAVSRAILRFLEIPRRALQDDLAPLATGDAVPAASRAFAGARAVQRFAEPLTDALLSLGSAAPKSARAIALPAVTAALYGYVAGLESPLAIAQSSAERLAAAIVSPTALALRAESAKWPDSARFAGPWSHGSPLSTKHSARENVDGVPRKRGSLAIIVACVGSVGLACAAFAATPPAPSSAPASAPLPFRVEGDPVDVRADKMNVDLTNRTADLTGSVTLHRGDLAVRCARVEARYDDAPRVVWAHASGLVVLDFRGIHAEATDAEIDLDKHVVDLHGAVTVTRAGAKLSAEGASLDLTSMRVSLSAVHGVIGSPASSAPSP